MSHLAELTRGERLWLVRRRRGESQAQAARRAETSRAGQWRREADEAPAARALALTLPEQLRLARRRSGLTLWDLRAELGVSRVTLHKWERIGSPKLFQFWQKEGFTFAQ